MFFTPNHPNQSVRLFLTPLTLQVFLWGQSSPRGSSPWPGADSDLTANYNHKPPSHPSQFGSWKQSCIQRPLLLNLTVDREGVLPCPPQTLSGPHAYSPTLRTPHAGSPPTPRLLFPPLFLGSQALLEKDPRLTTPEHSSIAHGDLLHLFPVGPSRFPSRNDSKLLRLCSGSKYISTPGGPHQPLCWHDAHPVTTSDPLLSISDLYWHTFYPLATESILFLSQRFLFLLSSFSFNSLVPLPCPQPLGTTILLFASMILTTVSDNKAVWDVILLNNSIWIQKILTGWL